jgi:hypothetical protein
MLWLVAADPLTSGAADAGAAGGGRLNANLRLPSGGWCQAKFNTPQRVCCLLRSALHLFDTPLSD